MTFSTTGSNSAPPSSACTKYTPSLRLSNRNSPCLSLCKVESTVNEFFSVILRMRLAANPDGRVTRPSMTALLVSADLYFVSISMSCANAVVDSAKAKANIKQASVTFFFIKLKQSGARSVTRSSRQKSLLLGAIYLEVEFQREFDYSATMLVDDLAKVVQGFLCVRIASRRITDSAINGSAS